MPLPQYLTDNADRIKNIQPQSIRLWSKKEILNRIGYDPHSNQTVPAEYQSLILLMNRFDPSGLQKEQVVKLYHEDLYLGYLATLLWGGLEKVVGTKKNFVDAIKCPKHTVIETLEHIQNMLQKGDVATLFENLNNPPYKVPGLGYAYYTKLFYFMGQIMDPSPEPVPLIFDKWLANAYCALSVQVNPGNIIKEFYPRIKKSPGMKGWAGEIRCTANPGKMAQLYVNYLTDFNKWSKELNVKTHQLEQFVFGLELRSRENKTHENPRVALWKIIQAHYYGQNSATKILERKPPFNRKNIKVFRYKYQPLENYLAQRNEAEAKELILSIPELTGILNFSLPSWAFNKKQDFWGSNHAGHSQKKAWMSNGFRVDTSRLDWLKKEGYVRFYKL